MLNYLRGKTANLSSDLSYIATRWQHKNKLPRLSEGDRLILERLKQEGAYITNLADLGVPKSEELITIARRILPEMKGENHEKFNYQLPQIYTVTSLAKFFHWGSNSRLLNLIENYIELPIKFHGVHLRRDFYNQDQFGTLLWHKDSEDRRMIKIIIYLHDVEKKHGPFEYVPLHLTSLSHLNGHRLNHKLRKSGYLGITDEEMIKIIPASKWKSCVGAAGTVIIADTRTILHHGTIRTQDRSALFFAYTANPPKRPELCTQYWDDTFLIPELNITSSHN